MDARGRRDAAFVLDALGDVVDPAADLGNAYAYTAFNGAPEPHVYAGAGRLSTGSGNLVFEFNQDQFTGQGLGETRVGDIRIEAIFSAGILSSVTVQRWDWDPVAEDFGWVQLDDRKMKAVARNASEAERADLWPKLDAMFPVWRHFQKQTDRPFPIVIISPTGPA